MQIKQTMVWLLIWAGPVLVAKATVPITPQNESYYEQSLSGWLRVNATVFNAPCNLQVSKKIATLTACGAGAVFQFQKLAVHRANTPVRLQFYQGQRPISALQSISLQNGDNKLSLPELLSNTSSLRLEVTYE